MEIITKPKAGVYFVVLDDKKGCHNVAALQSKIKRIKGGRDSVHYC